MTTTALVWLVVGLLSLTAVMAVLIALVRHVFVLGRAAYLRGETGDVDASLLEDRVASQG